MKELDTRYSDIEFMIFIFDGLKVIFDQKYQNWVFWAILCTYIQYMKTVYKPFCGPFLRCYRGHRNIIFSMIQDHDSRNVN